MKKFWLCFLGICAIFFSGCENEDYRENYAPPFHGKIYSFELENGQVGNEEIISNFEENIVIVEVEYGTDLTQVTPTIEVSPNATIEPASGETVDFTPDNQFTYTVTASSGLEHEWVVEIVEQEEPSNIQLEHIPNQGGWEQGIEVYHDLTYNDFLTRYSGWNGGDGAISLLLPDGSNLWSFQDSFFGPITEDRVRDNNAFVRNAGFIQRDQDLDSYEQLNPGTGANTDTWIEYPGANENNDDHFYWGGPAQVIGNQVQMLLGHIVPAEFAGTHISTDFAIFDLPSMEMVELVQDKYVGPLTWDSSLFKADDNYTYMYASEGYGICNTKVYVARVEGHDLRGTWEYLTKGGWVTTPPEDHEEYEVILDSNATQPYVFEENGKYYMVSQATCFGLDINIFESDSPHGPFGNRRTIYRIPERYTQDSPEGVGYITYNAVAHPQLSENGELVISYNINPTDFWDNFGEPGSADHYRPYFVRVFNWK